MSWVSYAFLIPLFPVMGFVLELFFGKRTWKRGGLFANLSIAASLVVSLGLLSDVYFNGVPFYEKSWEWFYPGINVGFIVDPLSIVMVCMVSFVGLLIHIFALGYMEKDPNKSLYFAETALFTGAMLGLILSNNFLQLFVFWELVGLCSYLLIGFWWHKPEAAAAAKKAWLFCAIGDFLFLLGIVMVYKYTSVAPGLSGALTFSQIFSNLGSGIIPPASLTIIALLILAGVIGKSAQFPLHGWIPDAMEGPTTVSALIHAATMVTAGIYLVARTFPLFIAAPHALWIVALIGGFTALFAATMALVVNDLKRVLAYSTISQLGYMLSMLGIGAALGVASIGYSMFHLIIHAFFKALLFLCSAVILHSMWNNRDIKEMGGLFGHMKKTGILMLIGALTLAGFPFTSGYFSKDRIIESAFEYGAAGQSAISYLPWLFLVFGVLLTAAYTFRAYLLVFTGKPRTHLAEHAHEPGPLSWMILPLVVLSAFSLFFGISSQAKFYDFLDSTFTTSTDYMPALNFEHLAEMGGNELLHHGNEGIPSFIVWLPTMLGILGIGIACYMYYGNRIDVGRYIKKENPVYRLISSKYYIDYIYKDIIAERFLITLTTFWDAFDIYVIDGVVNAISAFIVRAGRTARKLQTGVVQNYALAMVLGIASILAIIQMGWGA